MIKKQSGKDENITNDNNNHLLKRNSELSDMISIQAKVDNKKEFLN